MRGNATLLGKGVEKAPWQQLEKISVGWATPHIYSVPVAWDSGGDWLTPHPTPRFLSAVRTSQLVWCHCAAVVVIWEGETEVKHHQVAGPHNYLMHHHYWRWMKIADDEKRLQLMQNLLQPQTWVDHSIDFVDDYWKSCCYSSLPSSPSHSILTSILHHYFSISIPINLILCSYRYQRVHRLSVDCGVGHAAKTGVYCFFFTFFWSFFGFSAHVRTLRNGT